MSMSQWEKDRDLQSHRLSFTDNINAKGDDIYQRMFQLSYTNSGDQVSHLENTHECLVVENKWLSQTQFNEIRNLCWSLPGPSTVQVIITIVALKFKSLSIGINSWIIYNGIPWILLTLLGTLSNYYLCYDFTTFPKPLQMFLVGCIAAGAGIMTRSFLLFFTKTIQSLPKTMLILLSAFIFYLYRSQNSIAFCLAMSAIISLYLSADESPDRMSTKSSTLFSKLSFNFLLGKPSLFILIGIFFAMWIFFAINPDHDFNYVFSFYWIGCLIIGPIDAVFAYFYSILLEFPETNMTQFWIGLAITFFIPGSHLNIGIYFGSLLHGIRGTILAAIFLYIPCFLFLLGVLPQWKHYREKGGIKRIYDGLVCATTGLTLAIIVMAMEHCTKTDFTSPICIFLISSAVNFFLRRYAFMTIIIGGILGWIRYFSVNCYKKGIDCPFPFNF